MRRRGFTLVELLLALSLLSILIVALVNLIDTSLRIWGRTESQRDLVEISSGVLELLGRDLAAVESGPRGDLLADWWTFDQDGDGVAGTPCARLRFIKRPSAGELALRFPGKTTDDLVEVAWALLPDPEGAGGVLYRGERLLGDAERLSFFDRGFFNSAGKPPAGALKLVTGGVLWLEWDFASQTSVVNDGWSVGDRPYDCATAWDAWARGRPDLDRSAFNAPAAALPSPDERPILPRRVRVKLELERHVYRRRRPRLSAPLETEARLVEVDETGLLPPPGAMIQVDDEWMELLSASGRHASVKRGARGTTARQHDRGALMHFGSSVQRDVAVPLYREDWDL